MKDCVPAWPGAADSRPHLRLPEADLQGARTVPAGRAEAVLVKG